MTSGFSSSSVWILITAFLWGVTDPLLKIYGRRVELNRLKQQKTQPSSTWHQVVAEVWLFLSEWRYVITFVLNQCGSATFLVALANNDVSVAGPVANGLKFVFNFLAGSVLGEGPPVDKRTVIGLALIVVGTGFQLAP